MEFSRQELPEWVAIHSLLQGIFQTQESNLGLLYCRWVFLSSEPSGKPGQPFNFILRGPQPDALFSALIQARQKETSSSEKS